MREDRCTYCGDEPDWVGRGWIEARNNGPIHPCPMCNRDGSTPRADPTEHGAGEPETPLDERLRKAGAV